MEASTSMQPRGLYWLLWDLAGVKGIMAVLRTAWVMANNLYCIPAYFSIMTLLMPLLFFSPKVYWRIEEVFFDWLLSMVSCWVDTAGYSIEESGVDLEALKGHRFLFMPNHQSTADVPLCMTLFTVRREFCNDVMWVMDKVFKYTNFGSVSWMHDDFFILAGKKNRDLSLEELRNHLKQVFIPKNRKYLVLFPEGGFLRNRKKVSQSFAKKCDLPHLEHVTLPRTGALEVIFDVLGPKSRKSLKSESNGILSNCNNNNNVELNKIVDVTFAYPKGVPLDLVNILTGWREPCTTHVHYRVFDINEVPTEVEAMKQWMYQLYLDKEKMLAKYYQTGVFPYDMFDKDAQPPKKIVHDGVRFFMLHIFFMVTSVCVWTLLLRLKSSLF